MFCTENFEMINRNEKLNKRGQKIKMFIIEKFLKPLYKLKKISVKNNYEPIVRHI